ncbi:MAG: hypothetical protein ACR2OL_01990 [Anderseniella sp.]
MCCAGERDLANDGQDRAATLSPKKIKPHRNLIAARKCVIVGVKPHFEAEHIPVKIDLSLQI